MEYVWLAADIAAAGVFILGQIIIFIPQFRKIFQLKSSDGFSLKVPLVLTLANILRLFFWLGDHFSLIFVVQSFVMIACQVLLLYICLHYRTAKDLQGMTWKQRFWNWNSVGWYYAFLLEVVVAVAAVSLVSYHYQLWAYFQVIGYFALLTEACLGIPQFLKNKRNKSTEGLSLLMICGWLLGDAGKTGYYLVRNQPYQFLACGILQLTLDFLILYQVQAYKPTSKEALLEETKV